MHVVDWEWVRWCWGLTCEFAGVFGVLSGKKFWGLVEESSEQLKQRSFGLRSCLSHAQGSLILFTNGNDEVKRGPDGLSVAGRWVEVFLVHPGGPLWVERFLAAAAVRASSGSFDCALRASLRMTEFLIGVPLRVGLTARVHGTRSWISSSNGYIQ
jgi:hypothetical protein